MRKVLFDLTILETEMRVYGIGRHVAELGRQLARCKNVHIRFLERISWDGTARITDDATLALAGLIGPHSTFSSHWSWAHRLRLGLVGAFRQSGADLIHLPHSSATPLLANKFKRIITCHDLIPLVYPEIYTNWRHGYRWGRRILNLRRFRSADHIIAISRATASDLEKILNISPDKISVIYNGIDLGSWQVNSAERDADTLADHHLRPKRYLLYVGNADWRKNHSRMFSALAIARQSLPDLRLACVGYLADPDRKRVIDQAWQNGVFDAIQLTGYVNDTALRALYRHALATIFVPLIEGFGLPVLEGMASGCPVITSSRSSLAEIAQDAALQVDPLSNEEIAKAILALANNESTRRRLIEMGLERVKRFSIERQAEDTAAVYLSV